MRELFLVAAVICFGMAAIKMFTVRMPANHAVQESAAKAASKAAAKAGYALLTAEEAKARIEENEGVILLDVRTQGEYDQGHIPGSVCLPNETITADMPVAFDKDAEILVYCRSGHRSAEAAEKLAAMGYTNVADFGGIHDWPYEIVTD